ncbi:hypothetical protein SAMN05216603_11755 [Pseudomonas benzenivorans]|nr:hypothetical protein SAMN05216603_11755 [Pseudomonas benzenivorans]
MESTNLYPLGIDIGDREVFLKSHFLKIIDEGYACVVEQHVNGATALGRKLTQRGGKLIRLSNI